VRRFETLTALAAVVLASLAALQIPGRILFAVAAVVLLIAVATSRLRASLEGRKTPRAGFDPAERARQIQQQRSKKFDR